jgi:hypothetical protein
MAIISRGFSGRRSAADVKLPPGQYLTTDFPVLSAGPTPHVPLDRWEFVIDDGTNTAEMTGSRFAICLPRSSRLICTASRDGRNWERPGKACPSTRCLQR